MIRRLATALIPVAAAACGDTFPALDDTLKAKLGEDCRNQIRLRQFFMGDVPGENAAFTVDQGGDGSPGSFHHYCMEGRTLYPAYFVKFDGYDQCVTYIKNGKLFGRGSASRCGSASQSGRDMLRDGLIK